MKINEVEKLLGITKANIRFYEKENLLTPTRTEKGYRDYSEADILRLKEIIILRKLGIPINQIQDILNGALPLQKALDQNILSLEEEIKSLNGSLSLCLQLKREEAQILDTERYWNILQEKETEGFLFQSLINDAVSFAETSIRSQFFIPEDKKDDNKLVTRRLLLHALFFGCFAAICGVSFWREFSFTLFRTAVLPFLLAFFLIPAFFIGRKHAKTGKIVNILIRVILAVIILYVWMRSAFT